MAGGQIGAAQSFFQTLAPLGFSSLAPYSYHWKITKLESNPLQTVEFDKSVVSQNIAGFFIFKRVDNPGTANDVNLDIFPANFIMPNTTYKFELAAHYPDGTNSPYFKSCNFTTAPVTGIKIVQKPSGSTPVALCGGTLLPTQPRIGINNVSLLPPNFNVQWTITRYNASNTAFDTTISPLTLAITQPNLSLNGFWFNQNPSITPIGVSNIALLNRRYKFEIRLVYPDNTIGELLDTCEFTTSGNSPRMSGINNDLFKTEIATIDNFFLDAQAYPNPSTNDFTINVQSLSREKITMEVYNNYGQLIDNQELAFEFPSKNIGTNYSKGFYTVIITQGDTTRKLKLIKQ